jgi:FHS family L-fucose permease-like MFS transporter
VIQGAFADSIGIQNAMFVPLICYVYIAYFGYYCWKNIDHSLLEHKKVSGH